MMKIGFDTPTMREFPQISREPFKGGGLERLGSGTPSALIEGRTVEGRTVEGHAVEGHANSTDRNLFVDLLDDAMRADKTAEAQTTDYALGRSQDLHSTMASVAMADIKVSLLVNVRNKLIDAYREVMRMS